MFVEASSAMRNPTNTLHTDDREYILFYFWKSGTVVGMIGSMLICVLISITYEAISAFRIFIAAKHSESYLNDEISQDDLCPTTSPKNKPDSKIAFVKLALHSITKQRVISALLYGGEVTLLSALILLTVTFNVWIIISVILGRAIGYFIFIGSPTVAAANCSPTPPSNLSVAYSTVLQPPSVAPRNRH